MNDYCDLRVERDKPGVMTVVLDMPGRPINLVDEELLRDLDKLVTRLEQERDLHLVVFRSAKASGFLAGADVRRIREIDTSTEAERVLQAGQQLFDRIEALPMPTVAVIHGPCLGGGLEFALACRFRVARDDASTRIGCPETQLGLIPGWGGTQRLPRRVGLTTGLKMILAGERISAAKAQKLGLIDLALPPDRFEEGVQAFLTDRLAGKPVRRPKRPLATRLLDENRLGRRLVFHTARRRLGQRAHDYPALGGALRAIECGMRHGHARGLAVEREEFARVLFTPVCRHLVDLFFQRERARKPETWQKSADVSARPVKSLAVIGAGTMGAGIAQLAAYQGLDVVLMDIREDLVQAGLERITSLMQEAVRHGSLSRSEADRRRQTVTGTTQWEPLADVDLVIEAVVERLDVKRDVFRELDQRLPAEVPLVSNTSSLSISDLSSATGRTDQVAGLHFFNPVHRMQLVEVVRSRATSDRTVATLVGLVRQLGKVPIVVADGPGFLVNRILYPYLDEAVRLVCEGTPVEEVDRRAVRFGMPLGPLELLDQVGIDVAADVARTLAPLGIDVSPTPERLSALVERGCLGKKAGRGFYSYRKGRKGRPAPHLEQSRTRGRTPEAAHFGEETVDGITQRLILSLIVASAGVLEDHVVPDAWMVDLAMVLGTGFAPFRGGPLSLADTWGTRRIVEALEQLAGSCGTRFRPPDLLREMSRTGHTFHHHEADPHALVAAGEDHNHADHSIQTSPTR